MSRNQENKKADDQPSSGNDSSPGQIAGLSKADLEELRKDLVEYNRSRLDLDYKVAQRSAAIFIDSFKRGAA